LPLLAPSSLAEFKLRILIAVLILRLQQWFSIVGCFKSLFSRTPVAVLAYALPSAKLGILIALLNHGLGARLGGAIAQAI
jgi:hypothetical protein